MALLMFIVACAQSNDRYGKVRNVFYGLNWIHKALNMPNPCQNEMTCTGREAAKRLLSKPVIKKQPVTPRDLKKLVAHLRRETNLLKMRTLTMAVLSYAGFFRYDEVSRLRLKDIQFKAIYLKIYVKSSKTDQYKSGAWVHIARTNRSTCPYRILRAYLKLAELKHGKDIIFRGISRSKHGYKLKGTKPISYSTVRQNVLSAIGKIGLDRKRFGLHSFRRGGATYAANMGICDRLFKKHGRWQSENAKDGYVEEDVQTLLSVTKNLGI